MPSPITDPSVMSGSPGILQALDLLSLKTPEMRTMPSEDLMEGKITYVLHSKIALALNYMFCYIFASNLHMFYPAINVQDRVWPARESGDLKQIAQRRPRAAAAARASV